MYHKNVKYPNQYALTCTKIEFGFACYITFYPKPRDKVNIRSCLRYVKLDHVQLMTMRKLFIGKLSPY